jgi:SAM-dependent methyltransferase
METKDITPELIESLSYPDFVGLINQWNTLPGAYVTLSKLANFSRMTNQSYILEVGCSTGFSSRELAVMTGCSGVGFDRSENSIRRANLNKKHYAPQINIDYSVADGYSFNTKEKFTHIIVGGNLAFFPDPELMMNRCLKMLKDGGCVLATPYYMVAKMPEDLIIKVHTTLGIPLTSFSNFSYKDVLKLFGKLEVIYEDQNELHQETDEEIKFYCKSVIGQTCKIYAIENDQIYDVMFRRLFEVRKLINETRLYQKYCVLVLRYRGVIYPHRYVPLY